MAANASAVLGSLERQRSIKSVSNAGVAKERQRSGGSGTESLVGGLERQRSVSQKSEASRQVELASGSNVATARYCDLTRLFRKYDVDKSDKLEAPEVKLMLGDVDAFRKLDEPPTDEEVEFIISVAEMKQSNGGVELSDLEAVVIEWTRYLKQRRAISDALSCYDASGTGKLSPAELKMYLISISQRGKVSDADVEEIFLQADVVKDGQLSTPELWKATEVWQAKKSKSASCIVQ